MLQENEVASNNNAPIPEAPTKVDQPEKNVPKEGKPKTKESRGIKPQDKTGSYGEKRKPGDYLK